MEEWDEPEDDGQQDCRVLQSAECNAIDTLKCYFEQHQSTTCWWRSASGTITLAPPWKLSLRWTLSEFSEKFYHLYITVESTTKNLNEFLKTLIENRSHAWCHMEPMTVNGTKAPTDSFILWEICEKLITKGLIYQIVHHNIYRVQYWSWHKEGAPKLTHFMVIVSDGH